MAGKYGIHIYHPRFGESGARYTYTPETNSIAKGVASIKFQTEAAAEEMLSMAREKQYDHFTDVLVDLIDRKLLDARQIGILIKIDFFEKFGNQTELNRIYNMCSDFRFGDAKKWRVSKADGKWYEPILIKYVDMPSGESTAPSYTFRSGIDEMPYREEMKVLKAQKKTAAGEMLGRIEQRLAELKAIIDNATKQQVVKFLRECEEAILDIGLDDVPLKTKMENQRELMGYVSLATGKNEDRTKLLITNTSPMKSKKTGEFWAYIIFTQSIGSGKEGKFTVPINQFNKAPIKKGDVIQALDWRPKIAQNGDKYWWLYDYEQTIL